jgi:hypothetical protein
MFEAGEALKGVTLSVKDMRWASGRESAVDIVERQSTVKKVLSALEVCGALHYFRVARRAWQPIV